jgi:hypothetical protein
MWSLKISYFELRFEEIARISVRGNFFQLKKGKKKRFIAFSYHRCTEIFYCKAYSESFNFPPFLILFASFSTWDTQPIGRPREAPDVWCPRKSQNPPSNPQGYCPQIRTFGQGLPRDFQKRQLFTFASQILCSIWLRRSTGIKPSHASSEHVCSLALSAMAR